jgi:8-oxo-dGTP diphosphatase
VRLVFNSLPQETNTMFNRFLDRLRAFWSPALTNASGTRTIEAPGRSYEEPRSFSTDMPTDLTTKEKTHKSVTVVCACILKDGGQQILLSMRQAPEVPGLHSKWELPGGKIEFGETPEQTIVREIREELGITVIPRRLLPYLHTNVWEYSHAIQHVVLACYECEIDGDDSYLGGDNVKWFHINQIDFESTLPGTKEFVSLASKNEWFDEVYIEFEFVDRLTNDSKWFAVATQPTLYSRYGLMKYWGKIGTNSRSRIEAFESPRELDVRIFETAKRRLEDGYHISVLKGPERPYEVLTRIIELAKQKKDQHHSVNYTH